MADEQVRFVCYEKLQLTLLNRSQPNYAFCPAYQRARSTFTCVKYITPQSQRVKAVSRTNYEIRELKTNKYQVMQPDPVFFLKLLPLKCSILPKLAPGSEGRRAGACCARTISLSLEVVTQWSSNVALDSCLLNHQACQCTDGYQRRGHAMLGFDKRSAHRSLHLINNSTIAPHRVRTADERRFRQMSP